MGADSNGSQAKGGASGKGGTQADSNGARKKTSAPSVHDARKVSCPLILLGSVSARAPDLLHLNQASSRSGRSAIARRPEHELLPSSSDELSVGAAHSRSCASGNTLAPADSIGSSPFSRSMLAQGRPHFSRFTFTIPTAGSSFWRSM